MNSWNGGWNKTGLVLSVLAVMRSTRRSPSGGSDVSKKGPTSLLAGLGLSGMFFGMHYLLSDSSTMILWVWEGWPVRGPLAVPHGSVTLLAMGVGLMLGLFYPRLTRTWSAFGIASLGAALLHTRTHWLG